VIGLVTEFSCIFAIIGVQELFGIRVPFWLGSGIASTGLWLAVRAFAQRRQARMNA